jgi:hypothetical protein
MQYRGCQAVKAIEINGDEMRGRKKKGIATTIDTVRGRGKESPRKLYSASRNRVVIGRKRVVRGRQRS